MTRAPIITGHQHFQPAALPAPLEFDLTPGDAELVAKCAAAVDDLRNPKAAPSLEDELKAAGFEFVEASA